jgi:hypothetical protein
MRSGGKALSASRLFKQALASRTFARHALLRERSPFDSVLRKKHDAAHVHGNPDRS